MEHALFSTTHPYCSRSKKQLHANTVAEIKETVLDCKQEVRSTGTYIREKAN